ncbi:MAG: LolA-related protein [Pseudomonadota bacterium]
MRAVGCIAVAGWLLAGSLAAAVPDGLDARLAAVNAGMSDTIAFREERHSELLTTPALFEGTLSYDPESHVIAKRVTTPVAVSMTVDERYVTVDRDGETRRLKLSRRPELRALLAGFSGLLRGDTAQLDEHFELAFSDDEAGWRLEMTPRSRRLAKHVEALLVHGNGDTVTTLRTRMTNGDWQLMHLGDAQGDGE